MDALSTVGSYLLLFLSRNGSSGEIKEETLLEDPKMEEVFAASPKEEIFLRKRKAPIQPLELDGPPTLRSVEDLIEVPSSPEEGARSTPTTGRPSADKGEPGEEVQQGAFEPLNVAALPGVPQEELFGAIPQNQGPALPQVPAAPAAAPAVPAEPDAPPISFLRKRIKHVIRSCQRKAPSDAILKRVYEDLHLETANAEKRLKINQTLDDMAQNSRRYLYPTDAKDKARPSDDLTVKVYDWERNKESDMFPGVGINLQIEIPRPTNLLLVGLVGKEEWEWGLLSLFVFVLVRREALVREKAP